MSRVRVRPSSQHVEFSLAAQSVIGYTRSEPLGARWGRGRASQSGVGQHHRLPAPSGYPQTPHPQYLGTAPLLRWPMGA